MFQRLYDRALLSVSNISNTFNHRGTAFKNNIKNIECGVFFIGYFCLQKILIFINVKMNCESDIKLKCWKKLKRQLIYKIKLFTSL